MPTTLSGFLLLVVLLLPGMAYVGIRERNIPKAQRSGFRETAAVIAVSVPVNAVAIAVFLAVRVMWPGITPDIDRLVAEGVGYARKDYELVSVWAAATLALAVLLAALAAWLAGGVRKHQSTLSQWWVLFDCWVPDDHVAHVQCTLDDGSWVEGKLAHYNDRADDSPDRDLLLVDPIKHKVVMSDKAQSYSAGAVCVSARRIVTMFVTYVPAGYEDATADSAQKSSAAAPGLPVASPPASDEPPERDDP